MKARLKRSDMIAITAEPDHLAFDHEHFGRPPSATCSDESYELIRSINHVHEG